MTDQWFWEEGDDPDRFDVPLPEILSEEIARFYGRGELAVNFAQFLAAFLAVDRCRDVLIASLIEGHG